MISQIFLLCAVGFSPCVYGREYHFKNLELNWNEAQQFCRKYYNDLATVTSPEEADQLNRQDNYTGLAWIGLFDVLWKPAGPWSWSGTGTSLGSFNNWRTNEPNAVDTCVSTSTDGKWFVHICSHPHPFVCYTDGLQKQYHYISSSLTWADAVVYCRQNYADLAMIQTSSESTQVTSVVSTTGQFYIWIGLNKHPFRMWNWSDGTSSTFTKWGSDVYEQCAAEASDHRWFPQSCDQSLPFFCQGAKKKKSTPFQMKFSSDLDMTDPNNYGKLQQLMEEHFKQKGLTDIRLTIRSSPQKKKKVEESEPCIPL